jgi:chaperonin cofactor prefoldin
MADNDLTLSARVSELETQVATLKGTVEQLNKSIAAGNRMTNWQFVGFVLVMAGTLFGTLYWATGVLERRIEQSEKNLTTRIEQSEKSINARFEDLRQVVLTQQKTQPATPQR